MDEGRPLVAHVVHSFRIGGLENGIVNLINGLPRERFRHAVVCLTGHDDFINRVRVEDVAVYDLAKQPGQDPALYLRAYRLFRDIRPTVVHTRNLATLEMQLPAWLARVPVRIHGEHGRDASDPDGTVRKYRMLRRMVRPFVHHYVPLSMELEGYLAAAIGVPTKRMTRICNGVDVSRFSPGQVDEPGLPVSLREPGTIVLGVVARVDAVKDPLGLAEAFISLREGREAWASRLRLVWLGDGPMLGDLRRRLEDAGQAEAAWLPGKRDDIARLMRVFDVFVLPSLAEGISNTILEAMASGLPIVATRVGGNAELVDDGRNALLVDRGNPAALAQAIARYAADHDMRISHGRSSRERAERLFSLEGMVDQYRELYERVLSCPTTNDKQQRPN